MEQFKSLRIASNLPVSKAFLEHNIQDFYDACTYVQSLPYGRTSSREDFKLVLEEQQGTCSSKHALLQSLAIEIKWNGFQLYIGIYKMSQSNTKGIGNLFTEYNIEYIPEAHCYLKYNDTLLDVTGLANSENSFENDLLHEEIIAPNQVIDYKIKLHKSYLKDWIIQENIPYTFDDIWQLREQCITKLSV